MAEPRWPTRGALLAGAAYIAAVQTGVFHPTGDSVADAVVLVITAPLVAGLSLALGLLPSRTNALIGLTALTAALQWGDPNPFPAVITVGFWLVGLAVHSHQRIARALRIRAYELDSGRAAYTREALRYERTRIARELHDIVAHNLTVIVIQASAGRRLAPLDPTAPELLATIVELADQSRADVDGLNRLLDQPGEPTMALTGQTLSDLLARTTATGSAIICHAPEDLDRLPGRLGAILYRVLQEGLTNAIKHAPGAAIEVTIASTANVSVAVVNTASRQRDAAVPGSGRGLTGLTERVGAANGTFTCGPTPQGGWQLSASLPR